MDEFDIDPDRLKPEIRARLDAEDHHAIANQRREIILGWTMIAIGFTATAYFTTFQLNPMIFWKPAALLIVFTLVLLLSFDPGENPKPLIICGAIWLLCAVTMVIFNSLGYYLIVE